MATYVLVHGAWHGGWCWHRIVANLQQASHRALAPDLKSLGVDRTDPASVTLATWTEQICALIEAQPEPVILVGHSRGGIVISEVAERIPSRIRSLVYVAAFLLKDGQSLLAAAAEDPAQIGASVMVVSADQRTVAIRDAAVRETFYGACAAADVVLASALLVSEPMAPLVTAVRISEARFGRIPRTYIECSGDRAIPHGAQRRMQQALPCRRQIRLDTDHSPFFSAVQPLTDALLQEAL